MDASDDRLAIRLAWITGLRLGFLAILFGATAFFYLRGELSRYPQSQAIVLAAIGSGFALAAIYASVLRSGRHLETLAKAQIVLDQLTWTAIVYVSGGATSGATSFYALTCLVGAILVGLRGAAIAAVSGIAIFTMLCAGFAFGWIVPPSDQAAVNYAVTLDAVVYPSCSTRSASSSSLSSPATSPSACERRAARWRRRTSARWPPSGSRCWAASPRGSPTRSEPLGSISGSVEMLREAPGLGDEDKRLCDIIARRRSG